MREGGREEWPQVLLVVDCISVTQSPGRRRFPFFVLLYETKLPAAGAFVFVFLEHNTPAAGVYPSLFSCMNPILPAAGAFVFV